MQINFDEEQSMAIIFFLGNLPNSYTADLLHFTQDKPILRPGTWDWQYKDQFDCTLEINLEVAVGIGFSLFRRQPIRFFSNDREYKGVLAKVERGYSARLRIMLDK